MIAGFFVYCTYNFFYKLFLYNSRWGVLSQIFNNISVIACKTVYVRNVIHVTEMLQSD